MQEEARHLPATSALPLPHMPINFVDELLACNLAIGSLPNGNRGGLFFYSLGSYIEAAGEIIIAAPPKKTFRKSIHQCCFLSVLASGGTTL